MRETTTIEKGNFYMSGWCLCAKKDVFNKFILPENEFKGPFTEEFKTYFEDTDLGYRATELGIPFKIVPVPVFHFGKTTSMKLGISNLYLPAKAKFITKWTKRKNA
jgi:GT2 family glycosyltransferase